MDQPNYNRAKIILSLAVALLIVAVVFAYRDFSESRKFRVIFFDVGQGDAALVRLPSGANMMVDCGPNKSILHKLGSYLSFFDRTIDYLVVSHPDSDHYGGCVSVLKKYKVKEIIENGDVDESGDYWLAWKKAVHSENARQRIVSEKFNLTDGDAEVSFFHPTNDPIISKTDNNQSLVMRLTYATTSILFVGDIEAEREIELVTSLCPDTLTGSACPALDSDYLKVAHHGSAGSFENNFFRAVSPSVAVISVGRNNFGHPSPRIIKNLERIGAKVWRTDELGDIIIK